jgi:hypothetical protein
VRRLGSFLQRLVGRFVDMLSAPADARGFDLLSRLFALNPNLLDDVGQAQRL